MWDTNGDFSQDYGEAVTEETVCRYGEGHVVMKVSEMLRDERPVRYPRMKMVGNSAEGGPGSEWALQ